MGLHKMTYGLMGLNAYNFKYYCYLAGANKDYYICRII